MMRCEGAALGVMSKRQQSKRAKRSRRPRRTRSHQGTSKDPPMDLLSNPFALLVVVGGLVLFVLLMLLYLSTAL